MIDDKTRASREREDKRRRESREEEVMLAQEHHLNAPPGALTAYLGEMRKMWERQDATLARQRAFDELSDGDRLQEINAAIDKVNELMYWSSRDSLRVEATVTQSPHRGPSFAVVMLRKINP